MTKGDRLQNSTLLALGCTIQARRKQHEANAIHRHYPT